MTGLEQQSFARNDSLTIVRIEADLAFDLWRDLARPLLAAGKAPDQIVWTQDTSLFTARDQQWVCPAQTRETSGGASVSARFIDAARDASCFRDAARWALLYRMLWRLTHGEPRLLDVVVDDDVHQLIGMERSVRRDMHKMKAFVRFKKVIVNGAENYVAWHRPDHFIVRRTASWFRDRFGAMRWTILTPDASAAWDGVEFRFGPGVPRSAAPHNDELEVLWRTYYASTFNPARVSISAMRKEMPLKYWATLPETQDIDGLLREAPARVEEMMKRQARVIAHPSTGRVPRADAPPTSAPAADGAAGFTEYATCPTGASAAEFIPKTTSLTVLRDAVNGCRGCAIYCNATQGVFGEGPKNAAIVFVGEQPGDQEDRAGKPFVGPAGQVFNDALEAAGVHRNEAYVTNAVKHFKWEPRGTRRLHAKPSAREVQACRPWLETELSIIKPKMIVCLGATAAQSLMGPAFRITKQRGQIYPDTPWAPWLMATIHPSAILRIPDPALRASARDNFIKDLGRAAKQLQLKQTS